MLRVLTVLTLAAAVVVLPIPGPGATARAALNSPIPADGDALPNDEFRSRDALFAYVVSDVRGGRICIVPESGAGGCDEPAWGGANVVIGIGTVYTLIAGPSLIPGTWRLRTESVSGGEWVEHATSEPFTVLPCGPGECLGALGAEQAQAFKDASAEATRGAAKVCTSIGLHEDFSTAQTAIGVGLALVGGSFVSAGLGAATLGAGLLGIEVPSYHGAMLKLVQAISCSVTKMHEDIVLDPPDPNFTQLAVRTPVAGQATGTAEGDEYVAALAAQQSAGRAALTSYERYQGAVAAGDVEWQAKQADAVARFGKDLVTELDRSAQAARRLAESTDAANTDLTGRVPVTAQEELDTATAVLDRLDADGFTAEEVAELDAAGIVGADRADLLQRLRSMDTDGITVGGTVAAALRLEADAFAAAMPGTEQFARDAAVVALALTAEPGRVMVDFTAAPGAASGQVTFSAAAAGPDGHPFRYEWDFGDGGTSAEGPQVDHTYAATNSYLVRLTVTEDVPNGRTASVSHTIAVEVTPPENTPPQVNGESAAALAGIDLEIDVLANDSDPDGDPLTLTAWTAPAHGTVSCAAATCLYRSADGYTGDDSFAYEVSDGRGGQNTGTVTLTVTSNTPPTAVDDAARTVVGRPVSVDVTANDIDPDQAAGDLALATTTPPSHGTVECGPRGNDRCRYQPAPGFDGTDEFGYRVTDSAGASAAGQVTVTITPNAAPIARDDTAEVRKGTETSFGVLDNDIDPDGDGLTIAVLTPPGHGDLSCTETGYCTYSPAVGYLGPDSFTYEVTDGQATAIGTVGISVVPPCRPAACIDNGTVLLAVNPLGHLNAGDGTGSPAGPGSVGLHFIPTGNEATAPGCLCEGWGVADPATGVTGYANESAGTSGLQQESFTVTGGTAVSVVRVGNSFRVTHDYHPSAQTPNLYEVTVTIENISGEPIDHVRYRRVMDWDIEPTAFNEYSTIQTGGAAQVIYSSANGFASADPLTPDAGGYEVGTFIDAGPRDQGALFDFDFGALSAGATKVFQTYYGAAADEAGAEAALAAVAAEVYSFGQPSTDGGPDLGAPNTFVFAFKSVGGKPVFAPDAVDDTLRVGAGVIGTVDVLANDSDPDDDPLTVTTPTPAATHGTVACTAAGLCSYTPATGFSGTDTFQYSIADGTGGVDTATVTVTVSAPADAPPVAAITPAAPLGPEGMPIALSGAGSTDPEGASLRYEWDLDGDGQFDDATTADVSVTLPVAGTRAVALRVTDAGGLSHQTGVTVTAVNVVPVVDLGGDVTVADGVLDRAGSYADPGADSWTATVDWGAGNGPEPLALNGFEFELNHTYPAAGSYLVTVRVADTTGGGAGSDSIRVTVPAPVDLPPTAVVTPPAPTGPEGAAVPIALAAADPEGAPVTATWSWSTSPLQPSVPNCTLIGPSGTGAGLRCDDNGTVRVTVEVSDGAQTVREQVEVVVINADPSVGAVTVTSPVVQGTAVPVSAPYTDPGAADTHTCSVTAGPTTVPGTVEAGVCRATVTGLPVGSHAVRVSVTDDDGATATADATVSVTAPPAGCPVASPTVDTLVSKDLTKPTTRFVAPAVATDGDGELLLAFVSADGPDRGSQRVSEVTGGGLSWKLVARDNRTGGTTEVWQAYTTKKITGLTVTATLTGAYDGLITVAVFDGAATKVGATGTGAGRSGPAVADLTPKACGSVVWAVGHDWSGARDLRPVAGQSIVRSFIDRRVSDSYWVQKVDSPVDAGVEVRVQMDGFTKDRWTLAAVEIAGEA